MNLDTIKQTIPISDFLKRFGVEPTRISGGELFYHAPYRKDRSPSLTVNDRLGLWYDHGSGKGGSILDLAMLLYETTDVREAGKRIHETFHIRPNAVIPPEELKQHSQISDQVKSYRINEVKSLGANPAISNYLEQRGILSEAIRCRQIKEVYYQLQDKNGERKRFFGAGWFNGSEGVEIRSKYAKICLFKKDMSILAGTSGKINVFEGMMDFLSALKEREVKLADQNVILNSLAMSNKAILSLADSDPKAIHLFLDHGNAGDEHTLKFQEAFPGSVDCRNRFDGYGDYNEKIQDLYLAKEERKLSR